MSSPSEETRADVLLREALNIMAPLARLLVVNGVPYPVFAQALKSVFLEAARDELAREDKRITDSALSLLSGVHRKDVRAMSASTAQAPRKALSMASEVATRWLTDPAYVDADGRPRTLPIRARDGDVSFEGLSQSVSKDFHSRSVLDELERLGLARVEGDAVRLLADLFTPSRGFVERLFYVSQNVHDHLAAAQANLAAGESAAPFLEYAMFADGLSAESTLELHKRARQAWLRAFRQLTRDAADMERNDQTRPADQRAMRMRFGVYFYEEPVRPVGDTAGEGTNEGN